MPTGRPSAAPKARMPPRPNASTSVANASSHGTAASNDAAGSTSSRTAPTAPPDALASVSARVEVAPTGRTSLR